MNAFSGKRIRQNSKKLAQIKKRDRRLRKIGLSITAFASTGVNWLAYFKQRKEAKAA